MADLQISVDLDANQLPIKAAVVKREAKEIGDEFEKAGKRVKSGTSAAAQDVKQLEKEAAGAAATFKTMAASMGEVFAAGGPLSAILAAIGAALLAVAAAVVLYTAKMVQLVGVWVEYNREVKFASDATSIAVTTMSALRYGIESTGGKFETAVASIKEFSKTIYDANNGSKEASAKLLRLGIDGTKAANDLEGSLKQVLAKIVSVPEGIQRMGLASDAFGSENGPKMLTFLKAFNGDLDAVIKKANEMGMTLSNDNVRSAEEFEKALNSIKATVNEVTLAFGRNYLPVVQAVLDSVNGYLKNNQSNIKQWADNQQIMLMGVASYWKGLQNDVENYYAWLAKMEKDHPWIFARTPDYAQGQGIGLTREYMKDIRKAGEESARLKGSLGGGVIDPEDNVLAGKLGGSTTIKKPAKEKISDEAKQYQQLSRMLSDARIELQFFGQKSEEAGARQQILKMGIIGSNQALADQIIQVAKDRDVLIAAEKAKEEAAKARKEAYEAAQKALENYHQVVDQLNSDYAAQDNNNKSEIARLQQMLATGTEFNAVQMQELANRDQLIAFKERTKDLTKAEVDLQYKKLLVQQQLAVADAREIDNLNAKLEAQQRYKSLMGDLNSEYMDLTIQLQENTTGVEATRVQVLLLSEAYQKLTPAEQKAAVAQAQNIDGMREAIKAQKEMREQYQQVYGTILDSLQVLADEGFGGLFRSIKEKFKNFLLDMVAQWLTSKFFQLFFKGGNQQQAQSSGSVGGGGIGGFIGSLFGGIGRGGTAPFNGGNFAGASGGGNLNFLATGGLPGVPGSPGASGGVGGIGGLLGGLAGIFPGLGLGFGASIGGGRGLSGVLGGIGGLALGGAAFAGLGGLGGLVSSGVISAGTSTAAFGLLTNPFTIAAGAALLIGSYFLKRNSQRRRDEQTRNQGTLDALESLKQYDSIINDVRTLRIDSASGIAQGTALGENVRSQYLQMANALKDKKTRNIALKDVARIDAVITQKMAELRGVADVAQASSERDRRLIPEFANGVYLSPAFQAFRRQNGMIAGAWTGRDVIPAMLARGEMVLNPMQQQHIRSNAGRDVFRGAGIPGYADGGVVSGSGGGFGNINVTVLVEQDASGMWHATAQSDAGQRVIAKVVEKKYSNDELKLVRR